jgi:hypothetical protein
MREEAVVLKILHEMREKDGYLRNEKKHERKAT